MLIRPFRAVEFCPRTRQETGWVEHYNAPTPEDAVRQVLDQRRLSDPEAFVGPTGRIVYSAGQGYAVFGDLSGLT